MSHVVRAATSATALAEAAEVAAAALTRDAEAAALVTSLSRPPAGRRWTALATDGGVVMASLSESHPVNGYIDLLAVHPSAQGQGRGRALVLAAEEWLRGQGARQSHFAGNPPCYAWPGIDVGYTAAACLAESLGYERFHVAWNMTADLGADLSVEDDVRRLEDSGVRVFEADGDRGRVAAFIEEHWNDRWAWEATHASGLHYAERDGKVLGFAAWGARPGWFGPMGTSPDARGLGVGRVLLRRCLADQRAAGQASAQIGWVGPLRFYSHAVGARAERVFWLYRRDLA
ncbi:GNAT family N-acetyltransferase [Nonomuraea phyllanthi]|uniref:GNAT family N-acetyltransferase n=1 Tax=Nonomuraea phyllanthi TaxID=2219224 RepID=A0A5C4VTK4_9ACTN|nr:GNAT family N-acetyltransferase [Nonomuraea phyllanthi]KAB8190072.1 GNAT family N-acetyltransferase [Nonomuraea phyllanthi]QFY08568.1 GNAT family N-acetyltransferase [Nonomuraea phyllanthi]